MEFDLGCELLGIMLGNDNTVDELDELVLFFSMDIAGTTSSGALGVAFGEITGNELEFFIWIKFVSFNVE